MLDTAKYSISNNQFKVESKSDFGFYSEKNELVYFNGKDEIASLKAQTAEKISLEIGKWIADEFNWLQYSVNQKGKITYILHVSRANSAYIISDGGKSMNGKSDKNGFLTFEVKTAKKTQLITVTYKK